MSNIQKKQLLNHLIENAKDNPKILDALEKESLNIENNLQQSTSYNDLNTQLECSKIEHLNNI